MFEQAAGFLRIKDGENPLDGTAVHPESYPIVDRMAKAAPTTVPQTPLPNVTYAVGAIAIIANGNTIGGLGVSGAPGGQFDEECARAAMAKVKDRMK